MKQYKFLSKYTEFVRNMTDNTVIPLSWEILGENMVEFAFSEDTENTLEPEFISEITAVFTTANARLRLYDMLSLLHPSQIFYYDTDSCDFAYDPDNANHKYRSQRSTCIRKNPL